MALFIKLLVAIFVVGKTTSVIAIKLQEKFAWQELEFAWINEEQKQQATENGAYIPANNLPLGMDVWRDKLFITVPR